MECLCNEKQFKVAKVYRGETIVGEFLLKDDNGDLITTVDDVVMVLTDTDKTNAEPIVMRQGSGVEFDSGEFRFVVGPALSNVLPTNVRFEVKFVVNGVTRIAMRNLFKVLDNKVKDY